MIRAEGSDTMVNLAQAWAEEYHQKQPDGHGAGTRRRIGRGHRQPDRRQLRHGQQQPADEAGGNGEDSRPVGGSPAVAHMVGFDAMGIYVHPSNPSRRSRWRNWRRSSARIRPIRRWSQSGCEDAGWVPDKIIRVSRQNSSGTYSYFREAVLGKGKDMELGSVDANGSKDVVAWFPARRSIGYSGMGYATREVKMVKVAKEAG